MFDFPSDRRAVFIFSSPGRNAPAHDVAIAEARRRGVPATDVLSVPDQGDAARLVINGCVLCILPAAQGGARVFASTPDRVFEAELDACDADVVAAAGALPFTRNAGGRLWHSCGPLARPANDGTPRVWCSLISAGEEPGSLVFEHIALDYDHEAASRLLAAQGCPDEAAELLSGRWRSLDMLPKEEAKASGIALTPDLIAFSKGAQGASWPARAKNAPLAPHKFSDPQFTASGERRASVALTGLRTLWINTGTLCNLACTNCYIESTPRNDRLAYISASEASAFLDEIARDGLPTREIGFTGGEPFLNPHIIEMMEDALSRGFDVMMLTNAMKPMRRYERELLALNERFGARLTMRVSVDHYTQRLHELERGPRSWKPTVDGLQWLSRNGFRLNVAGRVYSGESELAVRSGFARLFADIGVHIDAHDSLALVVFPEMDARVDVPEITESCWGILGKAPSDVMCATSRMVVKRKGAEAPAVLACTLLAYDERFEMGRTLKEAASPIALNHPHCAKFCVLGGAACSR